MLVLNVLLFQGLTIDPNQQNLGLHRGLWAAMARVTAHAAPAIWTALVLHIWTALAWQVLQWSDRRHGRMMFEKIAVLI